MQKAVLFDLDNTLHDRDTMIEGVITELYDRLKVTATQAEWRQRFRELDNKGYRNRHELFTILCSEFKLERSVDTLVTEVRSSCGQYSALFPDAKSTLDRLRIRGMKLGVITNGTVLSQWSKIQNCGLESLVDEILISEREGIKKPHPDIFRRAAERLEVEVTKCVFVGDNPVNDIAGAAEVGMLPVFIERYEPWPARLLTRHRRISNLNDLLKVLECE
jgi:putative hydrolase of the HAD superfamily